MVGGVLVMMAVTVRAVAGVRPAAVVLIHGELMAVMSRSTAAEATSELRSMMTTEAVTETIASKNMASNLVATTQPVAARRTMVTGATCMALVAMIGEASARMATTRHAAAGLRAVVASLAHGVLMTMMSRSTAAEATSELRSMVATDAVTSRN